MSTTDEAVLASPIERLPDDVLSMIFVQRVLFWEADEDNHWLKRGSSTCWNSGTTTAPALTRNVCLVSRRWSRVAACTGIFWRDIVVPDDSDPGSFDAFAKKVERSKACLLHVWIRMPQVSTRGIALLRSTNSLARITCLRTVDLTPESRRTLLGAESLNVVMPNLIRFRTECPGLDLPHQADFHLGDYLGDLELTRTVREIHTRSGSLMIEFDMAMTPCATGSALSAIQCIDLDNGTRGFVWLLPSLVPALRTLRINNACVRGHIGGNIRSIVMIPELKVLSLDNFDAQDIIEVLRCSPNIHVLELMASSTWFSRRDSLQLLQLLEDDQDMPLMELRKLHILSSYIPVKPFVRVVERRASRGTPLDHLGIPIKNIMPAVVSALETITKVVDWNPPIRGVLTTHNYLK